jgi:hypothetical protein
LEINLGAAEGSVKILGIKSVRNGSKIECTEKGGVTRITAHAADAVSLLSSLGSTIRQLRVVAVTDAAIKDLGKKKSIG